MKGASQPSLLYITVLLILSHGRLKVFPKNDWLNLLLLIVYFFSFFYSNSYILREGHDIDGPNIMSLKRYWVKLMKIRWVRRSPHQYSIIDPGQTTDKRNQLMYLVKNIVPFQFSSQHRLTLERSVRVLY